MFGSRRLVSSKSCRCFCHSATSGSSYRSSPRHVSLSRVSVAQPHNRGKKTAAGMPEAKPVGRPVTKTVTKLKIADLPQGPLAAEPLPPLLTPREAADCRPAYPTVLLQARQHMRKFHNCVLLTRVGGFYELYFDHAEEYAPLLNIKLAFKKTHAGPVAMAGFPFFQLDRFLKVLVQDLNCYVAIADEFPNDAAEKIKSGGLMHDRKVTRVITPGTLIDENFMDPYASNYVLAIHVSRHSTALQSAVENANQGLDIPISPTNAIPLGLAWLELSTGHFFTQSSDLASLRSALARIAPREIVLDGDFERRKDHGIFSILADDRYFITYSPHDGLATVDEWTPLLESQVPESTRKAFTPQEVLAGGLVLNYVKNRLQGRAMKLQPPLRHENMQIMNIDKNSLRALEIKQTIRDGFFRGSLLHAIRRTVTKSGARLLNEWLGAPSTSLDIINQRQDLVAQFIVAVDLRDSIISLLRRSHDSQRLVQKFALGRGDADDLLALASTIQTTDHMLTLLEEQAAASGADSSKADCLTPLSSRIDLAQPRKLSACIKEAIDEEGLVLQHEAEASEAGRLVSLAQDIVAKEGSPEDAPTLQKERKKHPPSIRNYHGEDHEAWIMKPSASSTLKKLHVELEVLLLEKEELGKAMRKRFGASSLTLKWAPGLGHIAHIKGKDTKNLGEIRALSSSRSTRSFHLPEWTALGQRLDQARYRIRREEHHVFHLLREEVVRNLVKLRRNAAVLDELDIATSFAKLAVELKLVRPRLNSSTCHTIIGGRHPTVEGSLVAQGRSFVCNDCVVGGQAHGLLWLITGPNMAGKSTFLRQNALITILAQIGCYVPASFAELGIVDAIFSRVGSADNLYRDQSTFMVEMLETAQILKQATPRSFVVMDEIGRGTTPEDGTAVSFACLHHLVTINRCRTLFATHFHAVVDQAEAEDFCGPGGKVQMHCTDVEEDGEGGFVYMHKLRKGVNRQSHALKVASLAGLPESAIQVAQRILSGNAGSMARKVQAPPAAATGD